MPCPARYVNIPASLLGAACLILGSLISTAVPAAAEDEPYEGLVPGPNRDLVIQNCTACHSGRTVAAAELTRSQWDSTIDRMQEEEGLWDLEPEVREGILDYLEEFYGY